MNLENECVCVFVCLFVCLSVCEYMLVYGCRYVCVCVYTYTYIYIYIYVCMPVCLPQTGGGRVGSRGGVGKGDERRSRFGPCCGRVPAYQLSAHYTPTYLPADLPTYHRPYMHA